MDEYRRHKNITFILYCAAFRATKIEFTDELRNLCKTPLFWILEQGKTINFTAERKLRLDIKDEKQETILRGLIVETKLIVDS